MKLGLISDIHANLVHLQRACELLRELGAEAILCTGDLADGEGEGNAVVEYIREQGIPCAQGNHDHAMSHASTEYWLARCGDILPARDAADLLSDENRAFLRDLPLTRRFEWDGRRVLLTHASTWDQVTYVYANGRPEYFQRIAEEADADVVILGHTHLPMAVEVDGVWVCNPGSVDGNRFEPYLATCALLDLSVTRYRVFDIQTGKPAPYRFTIVNEAMQNSQPHTHRSWD